MTLQRKNIHIDATTTDRVNHAVLIGNVATPFALKITFQGFGFAKSCERVQLNILQQLGNAFHDLIITRLQPIVTILLSLLQ